jgi:hypothetical protein
MRSRVAANISTHVYGCPSPDEPGTGGDADRHRFAALSGDIGLRVFVVGDQTTGASAEAVPQLHVLCTTCNLDTDRVRGERYHTPHKIVETCVKGENEGIFYSCSEHSPNRESDPVFLEQLERFDVFGR